MLIVYTFTFFVVALIAKQSKTFVKFSKSSTFYMGIWLCYPFETFENITMSIYERNFCCREPAINVVPVVYKSQNLNVIFAQLHKPRPLKRSLEHYNLKIYSCSHIMQICIYFWLKYV